MVSTSPYEIYTWDQAVEKIAKRIDGTEVEAGLILTGALYAFVARNHEDMNIKPEEIAARSVEFLKVRPFWLTMEDSQSNGTTISGFAAISKGDHTSTAHIGSLRLAVDKDYWGQGIGSALIEHADEKAAFEGVRRLEATPYLPLSDWKYHLFMTRGQFEIEGVKKKAARSYNGEMCDVLSLVRFYRAPRTF